MTEAETTFWPIGAQGEQIVVTASAEDAYLLAEILGGEPADKNQSTPVAIPSFEYPPEDLVAELAELGDPSTWILFPPVEEALDYANKLTDALLAANLLPPAVAFLVEGLELRDIIDRLPSEVESMPSSPSPFDSLSRPGLSRRAALVDCMHSLWLASVPPDEWIAADVLARASQR